MNDRNLHLLEQLCIKLKKKPVYKTLRKIMKGTADTDESLKALFSIGTHIVIEIEQGKSEYMFLLEHVHKRIGCILERNIYF